MGEIGIFLATANTLRASSSLLILSAFHLGGQLKGDKVISWLGRYLITHVRTLCTQRYACSFKIQFFIIKNNNCNIFSHDLNYSLNPLQTSSLKCSKCFCTKAISTQENLTKRIDAKNNKSYLKKKVFAYTFFSFQEFDEKNVGECISRHPFT